jgi:hypothetical protein
MEELRMIKLTIQEAYDLLEKGEKLVLETEDGRRLIVESDKPEVTMFRLKDVVRGKFYLYNEFKIYYNLLAKQELDIDQDLHEKIRKVSAKMDEALSNGDVSTYCKLTDAYNKLLHTCGLSPLQRRSSNDIS